MTTMDLMEKFKAVEGDGVFVEKNPAEIGQRVQEILKKFLLDKVGISC